MKTILTGSRGFLGARLMCHYKDRAFITPHHNKDFEAYKYELSELWEHEHPEYLWHCAAISDTNQCEKDVVASYTANVLLPEFLAKLCAEYNTKMVFCSSDQVYFNLDEPYIAGYLHTEIEECHPSKPYGQQKLEAEKRIFSVLPSAVALRLTWMYDDERMSNSEHTSLGVTIKDAIANNQVLTFATNDYRCVTNVWEVVKRFEQAEALNGGVYNFGSSNHNSSYDFVKSYIESINAPLSILAANTNAFSNNPRNICIDITKARSCGLDF